MVQEIEVLSENWDAVQAFKLCRQEYMPAPAGGAIALGLSALEVDAALRMAGVPAARWGEVASQVQEMGRAAATALNERRPG